MFYNEKKLLIEPFTIKRKLPRNFAESEDSLFRPILTDSFKPVNVFIASNVYIVKDALMKGLRFIQGSKKIFGGFPFIMSLKRKLKRIAFFFSSKTEIVEKGVWIINSWTGNYFHWFADALPKLLAVEAELKGHKVLVPGSYKKYPYIESSLQKMGFDFIYFNDEVVSLKKFKKYKIKELLIVDELRYFNPAVMEMLRKRLSAEYYKDTVPHKKVYISREKAVRRKILNEHEVIKTLREFGFEIHYFEDYDFDQQIKLIIECKFLVSIHGAGLTNILFMKDRTNVMEFKMEEDYINGCYYSLANSVGINYYYLLCKGNDKKTQEADFTVNVQKLSLAIRQMINDNQ